MKTNERERVGEVGGGGSTYVFRKDLDCNSNTSGIKVTGRGLRGAGGGVASRGGETVSVD